MSLLKQNEVVNPQGTSIRQPTAGPVPTNPLVLLGPGEKWMSGILPYNGLSAIDYQVVSDVSGTIMAVYYDSEGNSSAFTPQPAPYDPINNIQSFQSALNAKRNAVQFIYTNGQTAQSLFEFTINFSNGVQPTMQSAKTAITDTNLAVINKTTLQGKENGTGSRKEATTTTTGTKVGVDVNVVNQATATDVSTLAKDNTLTNGSAHFQMVDGNNQNFGTVGRPLNTKETNPVDVSGLAKDSTLTNGTQKTQVINPTPATDITTLAKDATLTNIFNKLITSPSTEAKQDALNTLITTLIGKDFATQATLAAVLTLLGNGNQKTQITNFPTAQAVTGAFYQTTQPISAVSLPLPSGASTEATLASILNKLTSDPSTGTKQDGMSTLLTAIRDRLLSSIAVTGTFFQATQPVSATALPLPAGASTSANQSTANTSLNNIDTDLGAPSDAAATNTTASWSVIPLLKGLYNLLAGTLNITGTVTTAVVGAQPQSFNYGTAGTVSGVQTLKATAGRIIDIVGINTTSSDIFIQFFNTTGAVTLGNTPPSFWYPIDPNVPLSRAISAAFSTGLKFAVTTTSTGSTIVTQAYLTLIVV